LTFSWNNSVIEVGHLEESIVSKRFNFIRVPRAVI
jgi:hypothetical protein